MNRGGYRYGGGGVRGHRHHQGPQPHNDPSGRGRYRGENNGSLQSPNSDIDSGPAPKRRQISQPLSNSFHESKDKILPVHRPDKGGTSATRTSKLRVNRFPLKFRPDTILMDYNVDVKLISPVRPSGSQRISKSDLSMIRETLFSSDTRLPLEKTAYDGEMMEKP